MLLSHELIVDKFYNVQTVQDDKRSALQREIFYEYEPTPYYILDRLFTKFPFRQQDHMIDFGCGKGRVLIMAMIHSCRKITGYEINQYYYNIALQNIKNLQSTINCSTVCSLHNMDVQRIHIEDSANVFFFFNPFHLKVYIHVFQEIVFSLKRRSRKIRIIFYAPKKSTLQYVNSLDCFELTNLMTVSHMVKRCQSEYYEYAIYENLL